MRKGRKSGAQKQKWETLRLTHQKRSARKGGLIKELGEGLARGKGGRGVKVGFLEG